MYPYPPCFCFIISLIWNALVKIWKDLYFSHCNWSICPWTCCNSGLGWWQMSVSDHSQTKPICWRSFPFLSCLIWVNSRRFATSLSVVLSASTFMDQRWSLLSAPSYSFSLYNSFKCCLRLWKCECGLVLKSPHRLKDISSCVGQMVSLGSDYHTEWIFKSVHFLWLLPWSKQNSCLSQRPCTPQPWTLLL